MSDDDALLAAIAAQPDEDTPRLVYADWLEEHDQPIRAEFIRVQVEISQKELLPRGEQDAHVDLWKRNEELIENHRAELLRPMTELPDDVEIEFHRGFVAEIRTHAWRYMEHAETIAELRPFPALSIWAVCSYLAAMRDESNIDLSPLARSAAIEMQSQFDESALRVDNLRRLLGTRESWDRLRRLDLQACRLGDEGLAPVVASRLPVLEDLDLSNNDLTDDAISILLRSGLPRQLKRLILGGNPLSDASAQLLAEEWPTGADDRLEELNLRFTHIGTPGHGALTARFGGRVILF